MAEVRRMTAADVVAGMLAGEHGDFVREAVAVVARELLEAELSAGRFMAGHTGPTPAVRAFGMRRVGTCTPPAGTGLCRNAGSGTRDASDNRLRFPGELSLGLLPSDAAQE
jgi:hypothetical protein